MQKCLQRTKLCPWMISHQPIAHPKAANLENLKWWPSFYRTRTNLWHTRVVKVKKIKTTKMDFIPLFYVVDSKMKFFVNDLLVMWNAVFLVQALWPVISVLHWYMCAYDECAKENLVVALAGLKVYFWVREHLCYQVWISRRTGKILGAWCTPSPWCTRLKGSFHSHLSAESLKNRKGYGMEWKECVNRREKRQIKHTLIQGKWCNFIVWSLNLSYLRLDLLFQASVSCLTCWST